MLKKIIIICFIAFLGLNINAQETNGQNKQIAKNIVGQKAPSLIVDKWINYSPQNTKGKFILYHYWNPSYAWGAYLSIPRFNRLFKQMRKKLYIIGLTDAEPLYIDDIVPIIEYPYASAPKMIDIMEIKEFCHIVLVNPKGTVIWQGSPYIKGENLTDKELKRIIRKHKND